MCFVRRLKANAKIWMGGLDRPNETRVRWILGWTRYMVMDGTMKREFVLIFVIIYACKITRMYVCLSDWLYLSGKNLLIAATRTVKLCTRLTPDANWAGLVPQTLVHWGNFKLVRWWLKFWKVVLEWFQIKTRFEIASTGALSVVLLVLL